MSNGQKNNEEEVDLGSLFVIIGKGFSNLFTFIGSIFKGIFNFFIEILLFIKNNFIKLGIATIIGASLGAFLDYNKGSVYKSEMIVQPNFKSTKQLYANVKYFNTLTQQKNKTELEDFFKLSKEEANSLLSFEITPIITENDIVTSYDEIVTSVDTLAAKSYSYKQFKNSFTKEDYVLHTIKIKSTKNNIFSKFNSSILKDISDNNYFKNVQKATLENIERSNLIYKKGLVEVDSLRKLYAKVLLEEAQKGASQTAIDLGAKTTSTPKEIELFKTSKNLNNDLKLVNNEKSTKSEIVNVVSSFQNIGSKAGGLLSNNYLKFAILGGTLMTLFLLLVKLNTFLEEYKK